VGGRVGRVEACAWNIARSADDQVAVTQVVEEAPDVVAELRRSVVDPQANLLDDLCFAPLAIDELPDHASKFVDPVVFAGIQMQKDAALVVGKLAEGHVRVLSEIRVAGDESLQS
jgi:hypothetical protein